MRDVEEEPGRARRGAGRSRRVFLPAVAVFACGCARPEAAPTAAECAQAHDHLQALARAETSRHARDLDAKTLAASKARYVARCTSTMSVRQLACISSARNAFDARACEPEIDRRPLAERPRQEECAALGAHYASVTIRRPAESSDPVTEQITAHMAAVARDSCRKKTSLRSVVRCQLAASSVEAIARCEDDGGANGPEAH